MNWIKWADMMQMKSDSLLAIQTEILEKMTLVAWCEVSTMAICCLTLLMLIVLAFKMK